jgi:hypothetical protein
MIIIIHRAYKLDKKDGVSSLYLFIFFLWPLFGGNWPNGPTASGVRPEQITVFRALRRPRRPSALPVRFFLLFCKFRQIYLSFSQECSL